MGRDLNSCQRIEQSLTKDFGKVLWKPFLQAVEMYALLRPGDTAAVCVSGGKDSMVLAKLMQMLQRTGKIPIQLTFLMMDPGYTPEDRQKILDNAALLNIPLTIFDTNIFSVIEHTKNNPCFLCSKMRRGYLYSRAQAAGCCKIALGHHRNDVIETTVMAMLHSGQLQTMAPKVRSQNYPGMELIRPLYRIAEADIDAWAQANGLSFLQCACQASRSPEDSARAQTKALLAALKEKNPDVEKNIFRSLHTVCLDTFPAYKIGRERHSFLEQYAE